MQFPPGRPAHVVMLVANDVSSDTRVRKSALAVAALGARVTVLGLSPDAQRHRSRLGSDRLGGDRLGGADVVLLPVEHLLRDAARETRARRRAGAIGPLRADPDRVRARDRLARLRLAVSARQARVAPAGRPAPAGLLARRAVAVRWWCLRARGALRRRAVRVASVGYRAYDRGRHRVPWAAAHRRVLPEVDDYELAFGPALDALEPDLVHAHDVQLIGVADRAAARRGVPWVYDAHEWVPGLSRYGARTPRVVAAWADLERRHIRRADRVITVSPPLARALRRRHRLPRLPDLVLNVPEVGASGPGAGTVRQACALAADVPLLVYSGGVTAARGVGTAVRALRRLPAAHLAVVAVPAASAAVTDLLRQAERCGVADRVHLVPGVAPEEVVAFLAGADVGLIPLRHFGSHEMALANKLFEYLHAGVPMVVSDCAAQAEFVTEHGLGVVHRADDAAALAAAVERVLADPTPFRQRCADPALLARYTWQAQADVLRGVCRDLLGDLLDRGLERVQTPVDGPVDSPGDSPVGGPVAEAAVVLAIGPANSAGQGWAWSRAAARHLPGVEPWVLAIRNGRYDYPADARVDRDRYLRDVDWQLATAELARSRFTHVLLEAGRPLCGGLNGRDLTGDTAMLRAAGVRVAVVLHGSEARSPRRHRATHEFSPFGDPRDPWTRAQQRRVDALLPLLAAFDGPLFVSTPDQLDDVPAATWLPVVVDPADGLAGPEPLRRRVPVFVHAASNPRLKGTEDVRRVLGPLAERGLIELRLVTGLPPAQAAELVRSADVVVDQLLLGLYGVLACEAMAAGRLVLGHLGAVLRGRVPEPVPVQEATPATLAEVVEHVLDDRDWARREAARGPGYVHRVHDGRRAAAVLAPFLGVDPRAPQ